MAFNKGPAQPEVVEMTGLVSNLCMLFGVIVGDAARAL